MYPSVPNAKQCFAFHKVSGPKVVIINSSHDKAQFNIITDQLVRYNINTC